MSFRNNFCQAQQIFVLNIFPRTFFQRYFFKEPKTKILWFVKNIVQEPTRYRIQDSRRFFRIVFQGPTGRLAFFEIFFFLTKTTIVGFIRTKNVDFSRKLKNYILKFFFLIFCFHLCCCQFKTFASLLSLYASNSNKLISDIN